jgi:hypothetical protein
VVWPSNSKHAAQAVGAANMEPAKQFSNLMETGFTFTCTSKTFLASAKTFLGTHKPSTLDRWIA